MKTIAERFAALDSRRANVLTRAKEYAELSIPSLYPREGLAEGSDLPVPFSSSTARGITRLSSRLVSVVYPLNAMPFFEIELDDAEPVEGEDPTEEQKVLSRMARRMMRKIATTNLRPALSSAFEHLQVVGNAVLYINDNYNVTIHRLQNVVIRRRPDGEWHELIIREWIDGSMLPEVLKEANFEEKDTIDIQLEPHFTKVVNNHKGGCTVEREFRGQKYETGSHAVCPYIPMGWRYIDGENYARGLVEDNLGDIRALEVMAEALLDAIAANAEYRFGVNPAGLTEIHDLQNSVNGAFVPASPNDVFPIQLGNQAQVEAAQQSVTLKERTLGQVFLLNSAVQPEGERITATQIRVLANELEQALGGVLTTGQREFQIPYVRRIMWMMLRDGLLLPEEDDATNAMREALEEPDGVLSIKVRSGLEALLREVENEKVGQIMEVATRLPEAAQAAIIWPGLLNRFVSTFGIEPTGIVKSVQQMEAEAQQQQAMAMQQQAAQQSMETQGAIAEEAAAGAMAA